MRPVLLFLVAAFGAPSALAAGENLVDGQEIVVTAERRPQAAARLAQSVSVLDSRDLAVVGAQHPAEALNRLPGVNIHRNNGMESLPAIRSPVLVGGQSAGSFLVLEDGVPIRAPGFGNVNQLFEAGLDFAGAVEVTRGPGSALYGSNAVHGLVNIRTPIESNVSSRVRAEAGDFGRGKVTGLWGDDPGEGGVASELGLSFLTEQGWRAQSGLDQQQFLAQAAGQRLGLDWSASLIAQNLNQETASFIEGAQAYEDRALARSNPVPEAYRDSRLVRARATVEHEFTERARLRLTPFARWIETDLNLSFFPSRAQEVTRQKGVGLQTGLYLDPSPDIALIFGADVDLTRGELVEFQRRPTTGTFTQGLHYDYEVDAQTLAAYAQAAWEPVAQWRLIAGLRAETVRYDYDNRAPTGDVGRFRRAADRTDDFSFVTPKLGVVRRYENGRVWLNLSRGARPPQVSDLYALQTTQTPGGQKAETIDSAEIGWRGKLGPATVELVAYHMDKRDTAFRNADGFTVTGAKTRHQGVELSGDVPLTEQFALRGWVTNARHTYRFSDPSTRSGEAIRSGDRVDSAPDWLWNVSAVWSPQSDVEAELEWVHVGEYFTNAANTRTYPGHDLANLRLGYRFGQGLEARLTVRNIADATFAERADFAFGNDRYFPGEGRAVTVGFAWTGE